MKKIILIFLILLAGLARAQTVKVAAAGNLRFIMDEIKVRYAKINTRADIRVTLGSSGTLYQQILNGADFDLFLSADKVFPDKLKKQGMVSGGVRTYAFGKLVLWSNTLNVSKGMNILFDKSVHRIAVAKPQLAPYGDRAIQCLKYYNYLEKLKSKIVYADNIAQAAQFAQSGNAEVAFIALALALGPEMKSGNYFMLDSRTYKPVEQAMVQINGKKKNMEAAKFMQFVSGKSCKDIFEKYGFIHP